MSFRNPVLDIRAAEKRQMERKDGIRQARIREPSEQVAFADHLLEGLFLEAQPVHQAMAVDGALTREHRGVSDGTLDRTALVVPDDVSLDQGAGNRRLG